MTDFTSYGYKIIEQLGHNTYGGRMTYKAVSLNNRQPVVIKQFQFIKDSTWEDYKIIEQEIKTLQKLEHSGIPRYLNHFDSDEGICLVQEYKDAQPLSLQRNFTGDRVKDIAIKILEILVYLQNQVTPIIHRDLKPENILINEQDNIYLVDFGFSRIGEGSVNLSSFAAGTFGFMPPEQLHNLSLTKASDLYGLGVTLICLLTATKSAEIGSFINLSSNCLQFEHRMPEFSVDFIRWLQQMVQPDPQQRFPNAQAALKALQPIFITRSPEVKLSQSVLEFRATQPIQKQSQTISIKNSIPETILEGNLQVAANSKDPPHTPDSHAWIAITPRHFKNNQVQCKITVNTSRLRGNSVYQRWILLHTNAELSPYRIKVKVQTASLPNNQTFVSNRGEDRSFIFLPLNAFRLPYTSLFISLIIPFIATLVLWVINSFFDNLLSQIFNGIAKDIFPYLFFGLFVFPLFGGFIGFGLGWLLGIIIACLLGSNKLVESSQVGGGLGAIIVAFLTFIASLSGAVNCSTSNCSAVWISYINIKVLIFFILFIVGIGATIWTSIKSAESCRQNHMTHGEVIILSRLIPAFGISLGIGLMIGFPNPWIIVALAGTTLPVIRVIFDYDFQSLKQWRQLMQRKQKEQDLIEP